KSCELAAPSLLKSAAQALRSRNGRDTAKKIFPTPSMRTRADAERSGIVTVAEPLFGKVPSTCPNVAPSSVESRRVTLEQEIGGAVVPPTVHDTIADPLCSTAPSEGAVMP